MREITAEVIAETVAELCVQANRVLPHTLEKRLCDCTQQEQNLRGKGILQDLQRNLQAAKDLSLPICQDTGMAVIFAEVGQEVHLVGDTLENAVNEGVRRGYVEGLLRCSVVADPIRRGNTNDNTPAVLHTKLVAGDSLKLTVAPKGFGSENMSQMKMFTPSATLEDIVNFVVQVVKDAGSNPCPPIVLGIGIGGDFEKCAMLAKEALCRDVDTKNSDPFYAKLEDTILERVNQLNIGPQGFGGDITCLSVAIEQFPTHIAGLPVAVNVGCHVTRHASKVL